MEELLNYLLVSVKWHPWIHTLTVKYKILCFWCLLLARLPWTIIINLYSNWCTIDAITVNLNVSYIIIICDISADTLCLCFSEATHMYKHRVLLVKLYVHKALTYISRFPTDAYTFLVFTMFILNWTGWLIHVMRNDIHTYCYKLTLIFSWFFLRRKWAQI